ncbi:MAG: nuclear transport factor 2 family protein [Bacteroidales bacterium]|nr:nuclear transport factor 2 family protein [Bacteroidales bacterium]
MKETIENKIITLEKKALERWNQGDPSGFLERSANDVVYFDPFTELRIDGLEQLSALYETIRGKINVDRYEMNNPKVQHKGEMAVLTYNLTSYIKNDTVRWNCTEVFRKEKNEEWKIIQTHWSYTKPDK